MCYIVFSKSCRDVWSPISTIVMTYLAHKFRLYPTAEQEQQFLQHAGSCRWVWNKILEQSISRYDAEQKFVFYNESCKILLDLKKEYEWLKDTNSQSLQVSLKYLDAALKSSFKSSAKRKGFPKFKSKAKSSTSFVVPQHFDIGDKSIKLPKIGRVKYKKHRPIVGIPKRMIIRLDVDQWYVSIVCEVPVAPKVVEINSAVGIDLGIKEFAVTSDGEVIKWNYPHKLEKKIVRQQRELARKQKGSNRRQKARITLAKTYRQIRRQRLDFHHKAACSIAKSYDLVSLENLNIKGMVRNRKLARSVSRQGWYQFRTILANKLEHRGKHLQIVDRFFPSSKTCHACGWVQDMPLDSREYVCGNCGGKWDRDANAAVNIRNEGIRLAEKAAGTAARGDHVRTSLASQRSMKREATDALASW